MFVCVYICVRVCLCFVLGCDVGGGKFERVRSCLIPGRHQCEKSHFRGCDMRSAKQGIAVKHTASAHFQGAVGGRQKEFDHLLTFYVTFCLLSSFCCRVILSACKWCRYRTKNSC